MRRASSLFAWTALGLALLAGAACDRPDPMPVGLPDQGAVFYGLVMDQDLLPIAGATVQLKRGDQTLSCTTDGRGRFAFHRLPAGDYTARVFKDGYLVSRLEPGLGIAGPGPEAARHHLFVLRRAEIGGPGPRPR